MLMLQTRLCVSVKCWQFLSLVLNRLVFPTQNIFFLSLHPTSSDIQMWNLLIQNNILVCSSIFTIFVHWPQPGEPFLHPRERKRKKRKNMKLGENFFLIRGCSFKKFFSFVYYTLLYLNFFFFLPIWLSWILNIVHRNTWRWGCSFKQVKNSFKKNVWKGKLL